MNAKAKAGASGWTPERRAAQVTRARAQWTPERRAAQATRMRVTKPRAGKTGHKQTAEHRTKIATAMKGNTYSKGARRSAETLAKMSRAAMGNDHGKYITLEGRKRIAHAVTTRLQRRQGTAIELTVKAHLEAKDANFQFQGRIEGDPWHLWDFVLPDERILIEVDGCYWHGCERCGRPGSPENLAGDKAKNTVAKKLGWRLIRIKECRI